MNKPLEKNRLPPRVQVAKSLTYGREDATNARNYFGALFHSEGKALCNKLTIHEGKMRVDNRNYPVVPLRVDENGKVVTVKVRKVEEKGSDVALASFMVLDAAMNPADVHVLLSSDSDFAPTLKILATNLNVATGLFSPIDTPSSSLLNENPIFVKIVRRSFLEQSQFPEGLEDHVGRFHRPIEWA